MLNRAEILKTAESEKVRFLRLQFTDILGVLKNVEVPRSQFEKALDGQIMFDGSSIEGFVRIEESDMLLVPDLETFRVNPWPSSDGSRVARLICDVHRPDGSEFEGCPRLALRRQVKRAAEMGYRMVAGPEAEFFLFQKGRDGETLAETHDVGGYFDLTPVDQGEQCRRDIVVVLEAMGFEVEAAHHEVAPGQHEIDFKYAEALECADNISTFRFVVKKVALDHGLHATFMPKPIFAVNGSGMHVHQSLLTAGGENAFYDPEAEWQLSEVALRLYRRHPEPLQGVCARSPILWSTPTSAWCPATRRRPTSPGRRRTAVPWCGCPIGVACRPAASCGSRTPRATPIWRWR